MPDKDRAIELELHQILQADRQAVDLLRQAEDTRRAVLAKTEAEKADILADAQRQQAEISERVKKELEGELQQRLAQEDQRFADQTEKLEKLVSEHRAQWVEGITSAILAPPKGN